MLMFIQEFIPTYLLRGLIPAALLRSHDFWQDTGESCRCGAFCVYEFVGSELRHDIVEFTVYGTSCPNDPNVGAAITHPQKTI